MTNDIRAITDRIERREADRRQQLGRRATDLTPVPGGSGARVSGPKHTFSLSARVFFTVDNFGKVTKTVILPSHGDPIYEESTEEIDDAEQERIFKLADAEGWMHPVLGHLPAGVRWEG